MLCGCTSNKNASSSQNDVSSKVQSQVTSDVTKDDKDNKEKYISIACSITDSFCPYNALTRLNREISTLLYDSLVVVDSSFTPQNSLAEKIKIKGTTVTVTLKTTFFTDGTNLTADDVVYCANRAMESGTRYEDALKDVSSVSAETGGIVVFKLKKEDPFFANQLDFPIYKKNSDKKISSDNIQIPPIGSGRYVINKDKTALIANENFHNGAPRLKKINLINTPDEDALLHNMEVGNINYYYSNLSDCELPSVRGGYKRVNLNNLVFLGANMHGGIMLHNEMRQVVSAAIDRDAISNEAYYQNAISANGIFNPNWKENIAAAAINETTTLEKIYVALREEIGYNKKDNRGYYVNSDKERLTVKLVYYKGNEWRSRCAELIKSQLKIAGIKVNLEALSWKDYKNSLKNGYYDLYLAEVRLGNNMDISELVTKGGSLSYGIDYGENSSKDSSSEAASSKQDETEDKKEEVKDYAGATAKAVKKFYEGKAELTDVVTAFSNELPIIPVCYRTGIVSHDSGISGVMPCISDVYYSIENTTIK